MKNTIKAWDARLDIPHLELNYLLGSFEEDSSSAHEGHRVWPLFDLFNLTTNKYQRALIIRELGAEISSKIKVLIDSRFLNKCCRDFKKNIRESSKNQILSLFLIHFTLKYQFFNLFSTRLIN